VVGIALTFWSPVGCQIIASRLRIPAIILRVPVGFIADKRRRPAPLQREYQWLARALTELPTTR